MLRKISTIDFKSSNTTSGKTVLIRVDYNVPVENELVVDDYRILKSIPTIEYCLDQGAKVVLMSHMGRPKGKIDDKLSLIPAGEKLAELLEMPIKFSEDCISEDSIDVSRNLKDGEIHLLENLRFYNEETENSSDFSSQLAKHGSIYINDAFGTAHRNHASNSGITKHFATKGMGLLIEQEMKFLSDKLSNPSKPLTLIIGGSKIDTKIGVIENFLGLADNIIIGGAMANTFLLAMNHRIGISLAEKEKMNVAKNLLKKASKRGTKIILPIDFSGELETFGSGDICVADAKDIPNNMICEDIGEKSIKLFSDIISLSKTILWNGTVGVAENPNFAVGTNRIVDAIIENQLTSIVGGGDTVAAIRNYNEEYINDFSHVSTGGGSCLEMLSGKKLPALEMLKK
jgi:phosphoglycerate kinase|tara:strand:- start:65 stop:1267 length:1203 start_codon:yes stop_codon:yes gene_type:complete